jgi:energy-coupling factor transport system permease protein
LIALGQYLLARLTWAETRRFWLVISILIVFFTLVNSTTMREFPGEVKSFHALWQGAPFAFLRWTITPSYSVEQLFFAATMFVRLFAMALLSLIIPFTIHPAQYGIAFKRLGLGDKFAFAMDLAFRFIPSLGADFETTLAAQRARGYELERIGGGVAQQVRNLAPLVVPVTLRAILDSEEVVDAMDLRAFGTHPRTWYHALAYRNLDKIVIGAGVAILVAAVIAGLLGYGKFWMPGFVIAWVGG